MKNNKIIQQGAEAIIYLDKKKRQIIKHRISKSYRIKELDEKITKLRTRSEGKILDKVSKIVSCPKIIKINEKQKIIIMEFIPGEKLSENLNKFKIGEQKNILKKIGEQIGKIHSIDIIHGDLTTSNMILKKQEIYLIDFGLGFHSRKIEDKAVDLHLLKQALEAKHFENWEVLFKELIKGYSKYRESKKVLERLRAVEKRGRYKH